MEDVGYLDFDLQIERAGQGYRVRVLGSPAGQASSDFVLPFSDLELENFVLRMSRTHSGTRRLGTPEFEAARSFGGRLFEAVFAGEVRGCLRSSLDAASREGRGLRLRLHLTETPELVDLPWEYLYNPALNRFFVLSSATPVVRYLDLPERVPPLTVHPPLRLLAMIASPRDYPALDVEREWEKLRGALKELEEAGLVALERLQPPTLNALQRRLRAGPCHILHFIGHGAFDESTQDGVLLLEDHDGLGRVVSSQDLGVLLHDHASMRLVVLNSCEGARTSRTDPFAGAAQSLVQQGMPAVLAMQFEISDEAAIVISHEFYAALAGGYPVDAALAEARKAAFTSGSGAEWGTPVLYLRAADGRIFGVEPRAEPVQRVPAPLVRETLPEPETPVAAASAARDAGDRTAPAASPEAPQPAALATPVAEPEGGTAAERKGGLSGSLRWVLLGVVAFLALVFGASRLIPNLSGVATQSRTTPGGAASTTTVGAQAGPAETRVLPPGSPAPAAPSPANQTPASGVTGASASIDRLLTAAPRVFSTTALILDLIPQDDGVWAATSGGLVRWRWGGAEGAVASEPFDVSDGLPFNRTYSMLAMPDGSLWAASQGAAADFTPTGDGLGPITKYSEAEGVNVGQSPSLMLDGDGSIWLASMYTDTPVQRFDGSLWRPPAIPTDDPALSNLNAQVTAIMRAKDGAAWIGTDAAGILRWDGKAWTVFGAKQGVPSEHINRVFEDSSGTLWAAAGEGGLLQFKPDDGSWQRVEFQRPDAPVYWVGELDKSLWASGDNFIARSDDGGQRWSLVATPDDGLDHPTKIVKDGAGRIWAATQQGIATYEDGQWRRWQRPGEVSWYAMGQIVADPGGKLWVRPEYGGDPSVIDPASGQVNRAAAVAPRTAQRHFAGIRGRHDLGRHDGRAAAASGRQAATMDNCRWPARQPGYGPGGDSRHALGRHACRPRHARSRRRPGDGHRRPLVADHYVDRLLVAPDGAVWAGAHWGADGENSAVVRLAGAEHQAWQSPEAPLTGVKDWVNALAADDSGGIWVASGTGVSRWDGKRWDGWSSGQAGPASEVFAFLPEGSAMWAAGHSNVIDRWDGSNGWQHFRAKGLSGDVLDMHTSADGALWLATQDGVLRYGP